MREYHSVLYSYNYYTWYNILKRCNQFDKGDKNMSMFNEMASISTSYEMRCKNSKWLSHDRKEMDAENFDLDQFLADHYGEYNIFVNGGCNCRTGEGYSKCVVVYKEHSITLEYAFPNQTSTVSAIVSGLLEVLGRLNFSQKKVNLVLTQEMSIVPCGNMNSDNLKEAFCKLCKEKEFAVTVYRLRGEAAANTIRQLVGMPVKISKKFSKVNYTGKLPCLNHLL